PEFGWLAFSGNLTENDNRIRVELTTASKARVFLAEEKLWITTDAGQISSLLYNPSTKAVELTLRNQDVDSSPYVLLNIVGENHYIAVAIQQDVQGRYPIPNTTGKIKLVPKKSGHTSFSLTVLRHLFDSCSSRLRLCFGKASTPLRLLFDSCSSVVRLLFDSASGFFGC